MELLILLGLMAALATSWPAMSDDKASVEATEMPTAPADGTYTTAAEVRPALDATRFMWVRLETRDDEDRLDFSGILDWRCGLGTVAYGLNGAEPVTPLRMEPCHEDRPDPNQRIDAPGYPPFVSAPPGSVESLEVVVTYDDGTTDGASFTRAELDWN